MVAWKFFWFWILFKVIQLTRLNDKDSLVKQHPYMPTLSRKLLTLSQTRCLRWLSPTSSALPLPHWSPGRCPLVGPQQESAAAGQWGVWRGSCCRGCWGDRCRWKPARVAGTKGSWCWRRREAGWRCYCCWGEVRWWWEGCSRSTSPSDGSSCSCRSAEEGSWSCSLRYLRRTKSSLQFKSDKKHSIHPLLFKRIFSYLSSALVGGCCCC